jgi:hypothetical protein
MIAAPKLTTEIERVNARARFVVSTLDPVSQDRLEHLGYLGIGGDLFATRWFPDGPSIPRYYERFAASIESMVLQSARLVPIPWEEALEVFLRRVAGSKLTWWLYGSAAVAVRGIEISPGDIDISVDEPYLAGEIFDDLLVTPVEELDGWVARYVGRAFDAAIIEWTSDPHADNDGPARPGEFGPNVAPLIENIEWHGRQIGVPPLSVQFATCQRRGQTERIELVRAAMRH